MDGKTQTSFIPKQPLVATKAKKKPVSIFSVIAWFLFLIVALASVGVFFYKDYLNKAIKAKNAELSNGIKSFDVSSINHFVQLNSRMQVANTLLDNHLAVSTLLGFIAENTVRSVQFTDLKYSSDDTGKLSLVLGGKAPNFASVALQSDRFSTQSYLQNQVFSNLGLDVDGGVLFRFSAVVDPSSIRYKGINQ